MNTQPPPISRYAICVAIFDALSTHPELVNDAEVLTELKILAQYHLLKRELPPLSRGDARSSLLANCQKLRTNLEREKAQLELWELSQGEEAIKAERVRLDEVEAELRQRRDSLERIVDPTRRVGANKV